MQNKINSKLTPKMKWNTVPWYVILVSAYPILALLAHNATEVPLTDALLPLGISAIGAMVVIFSLHVILRNWQSAALVTTILLIMFFSYGHIYSYLKGIQVAGFFVFSHRNLVPIFIILAGLGTLWAFQKKRSLENITIVLNLTSMILIIMPVFQISLVSWRKWKAWHESSQTVQVSLRENANSSDQEYPDIYYIILDAYGRSDIIKTLYDYDNSDFINSLESLGFYVADCSQSNYAQTELSLASSLNMDYLDALNASFISGNTDRSPLWPLIKHSAVRAFLESLGYKTVAFATGYGWTEIDDADIYLAPQIGAWELVVFNIYYYRPPLVESCWMPRSSGCPIPQMT
jgi:hypothetical protein